MITSTIDALIAGLHSDEETVVSHSKTSFHDMIDAVGDEFRRDVSGRKPDDTGLNIRSGRLLASIETLSQPGPGMVTFAVFNSGAPYWAYHQDGAGKNPKRLFWDEFWAVTAPAKVEFAGERVLEAVA